MSGLHSRRKGVRVELAIAKLIGARKVSRTYQAGHDLELPLGDDRMLRIECKARADGFGELYRWIDPVADDILRALRQSAHSGMTRTEISNLFGRHRTTDQIGAALQLLSTKGRIRSESKRTNGRPSEVWVAVAGAS